MLAAAVYRYVYFVTLRISLLKFIYWGLGNLKPRSHRIPVATLRRVLLFAIRPLAGARSAGMRWVRPPCFQVVLTMYLERHTGRSFFAWQSFHSLGDETAALHSAPASSGAHSSSSLRFYGRSRTEPPCRQTMKSLATRFCALGSRPCAPKTREDRGGKRKKQKKTQQFGVRSVLVGMSAGGTPRLFVL